MSFPLSPRRARRSARARVGLVLAGLALVAAACTGGPPAADGGHPGTTPVAAGEGPGGSPSPGTVPTAGTAPAPTPRPTGPAPAPGGPPPSTPAAGVPGPPPERGMAAGYPALNGSGLATIAFGTPMDEALPRLRTALGPSSEPYGEGGCPGWVVTHWPALDLHAVFHHFDFAGWWAGPAATGEPPRTAEGVHAGQTVAEARAVDARLVFNAEPPPGNQFHLDWLDARNAVGGSASGTGDRDRVTELRAGNSCRAA